MPRRLFTALLLVAVPRVALACPVCFGRSDSPAAQAINMGIFVLLGMIGAVLAAFAYFMVYLNRRAKLVAKAEPVGQFSLQGKQSEEGTAVC